mmetsp:Transcript_85397/g.241877  ORF Transcript_85397/g.241877 Transcript_85397/m.241877 type:complete len:275 (+) Transcript_85397:185-1009(+)
MMVVLSRRTLPRQWSRASSNGYTTAPAWRRRSWPSRRAPLTRPSLTAQASRSTGSAVRAALVVAATMAPVLRCPVTTCTTAMPKSSRVGRCSSTSTTSSAWPRRSVSLSRALPSLRWRLRQTTPRPPHPLHWRRSRKRRACWRKGRKKGLWLCYRYPLIPVSGARFSKTEWAPVRGTRGNSNSSQASHFTCTSVPYRAATPASHTTVSGTTKSALLCRYAATVAGVRCCRHQAQHRAHTGRPSAVTPRGASAQSWIQASPSRHLRLTITLESGR